MPSRRWFKGNTHTHTDASDGDAPLGEVAGWYATHGYDFLVVTDHNHVTDLSGWGANSGALLLVPGCEVSLSSEGKPVHINCLGSTTLPDLSPASTIPASLQRGVDAVRTVGGVPQINHPNFKWAFTDEHLSAVTNYRLLEVFNGSTDCNNHGGGGHPSVEEIWDRLLTAGQRIWGVASDDAHDLHGEIWEDHSPPGRAWVMVRAEEKSVRALLRAMEHGQFYASTEIAITDMKATPEVITLRITQARDYRYTTRFIGAGGQTLAVAHGLEAAYHPRGHEGYVRARVTSSNGGVAWTQPQFLR